MSTTSKNIPDLHLVEAGEESRKKEKFIQVGKHRHRIANDHHAMLSQLDDDFRYMSMGDLLMYTSFVGATILQMFSPITLINSNRKGR